MLDISLDIGIPTDLPADGRAVLDAWTEHAQELADELNRRIRDRTPVLTGALQSGVMAIGGIDHGYPQRTLLEAFFDPAPQIATWKRQYDVYQEGPPLGLPTYTNPPRWMLRRTDPDDLPLITEWAVSTGQTGADSIFMGDAATGAVEVTTV